MASEITDTDIATLALAPAEISVDGQTVKEIDPIKVLEVQAKLKANTASAQATFGLRFSRISPPGAV